MNKQTAFFLSARSGDIPFPELDQIRLTPPEQSPEWLLSSDERFTVKRDVAFFDLDPGSPLPKNTKHVSDRSLFIIGDEWFRMDRWFYLQNYLKDEMPGDVVFTGAVSDASLIATLPMKRLFWMPQFFSKAYELSEKPKDSGRILCLTPRSQQGPRTRSILKQLTKVGHLISVFDSLEEVRKMIPLHQIVLVLNDSGVGSELLYEAANLGCCLVVDRLVVARSGLHIWLEENKDFIAVDNEEAMDRVFSGLIADLAKTQEIGGSARKAYELSANGIEARDRFQQNLFDLENVDQSVFGSPIDRSDLARVSGEDIPLYLCVRSLVNRLYEESDSPKILLIGDPNSLPLAAIAEWPQISVSVEIDANLDIIQNTNWPQTVSFILKGQSSHQYWDAVIFSSNGVDLAKQELKELSFRYLFPLDVASQQFAFNNYKLQDVLGGSPLLEPVVDLLPKRSIPGVLRRKRKGRGVMYMVWGTGADEQLARSKASMEKFHPELPIKVIRMPENTEFIHRTKYIFEKTPFEETLYIDADTVVMDRLDFGFEKAKEHGMACCICECPWARRYRGTHRGDTVEYNAGIHFFTSEAEPLFRTWHKLNFSTDSSIFHYRDNRLARMESNDQSGLAGAIDLCGWSPYILPQNWNFRPGWHFSVFGPIKIWHDNRVPPPEIHEWNEHQRRSESIVQFSPVRMGMTPAISKPILLPKE